MATSTPPAPAPATAGPVAGTTNPISRDGIMWWNMHIPAAQHTATCPDFLQSVDDADRATLATHDADYHRTSWVEVVDLIRNNHLERFKRLPSDLRRYREYMAGVRAQHGSILAFILAQRLHWSDLTPASATPFAHPADYRVLRNDWPYGVDERIVHLVVWTKFGFAEDPVTRDLTDAARAQIEGFVRTTFARVPQERVIWFKNWAALKSVHAVEHFHVMLFEPGEGVVEEITGGDVVRW